jgi:hypothetical protein
MDGSLVVVIAMAMQWLKKQHRFKIPEWVVPLIPFVLGWVFAVPVVYIADDGAKAIMVVVAQVFWEGIKAAIAAMAAYKITHEIKKAAVMPEGKGGDQ